jgi:hypothetical protein
VWGHRAAGKQSLLFTRSHALHGCGALTMRGCRVLLELIYLWRGVECLERASMEPVNSYLFELGASVERCE